MHTGNSCQNFFHSNIIPPGGCLGCPCPEKQTSSRDYNLFVWFAVFQPKWNYIKKTYKYYQTPVKSYWFWGYYQSLFNVGWKTAAQNKAQFPLYLFQCWKINNSHNQNCILFCSGTKIDSDNLKGIWGKSPSVPARQIKIFWRKPILHIVNSPHKLHPWSCNNEVNSSQALWRCELMHIYLVSLHSLEWT